MNRYPAILGLAMLLILAAIGAAEENHQQIMLQQMLEAERLAELLATKGVITPQELIEVSTSAATASTEAKTERDRDPLPFTRTERDW